ncbi:MAG TPA: thioredoxin-disulfide reductase [bacterium]
MPEKTYNVIIIGGGPAGYTAALYTGRANLSPLLLEGLQPGGQLSLTTTVENFPGFPEGVQGPGLMDLMKKQAQRFGAEIVQDSVTEVNFKVNPFVVKSSSGEYNARAVIIATGAYARMLGLDSEKVLLGRGLSTCATCDGAFFKNQRVIVVGGGDSAVEDALFLKRFASSVTIVHRRDKLRASKIMQDRAMKDPRISFIWNAVIDDLLDSRAGMVTGVVLRDVKTGEKKNVDCDGVFVAIGHEPNTSIFKGQIDLDEKGYIAVKNWTRTNIDGVFACGDVVDHRYKQAVTAAGMGCMAAIDIEKYLEEKGV